MTTTTSTFHRSSSNAASVHIVYKTRADGDFHCSCVPYAVLDRRRRSAITDIDDAVLGCWVGDCVLIGVERQIAVAHAGWRGLAVETIGGCTGYGYNGFSHRRRGDRQRHVVAVWQAKSGQTRSVWVGGQ